MTAQELAALHKRCFTTPPPWTMAAFAGLLIDPLCFLCTGHHGFALGRAVAGEAELLTIAVAPEARRSGQGRALLQAFEDAAQSRRAEEIFLEVAANNRGAIALYHTAGYGESGHRPRYYQTADGQKIDAVLMKKTL